jgi:glycosyltransferase involved in cell wall biosynthesis
MTRILTITAWYPPHHYGGYELACADVMTRYAERGHDVRVLCTAARLPDVDAGDDGPVDVRRELHMYAREGQPYRPALGARLAIERHNARVLRRHLRDHRPEVVSLWQMGAMSLGLLRQLVDDGVPLVFMVCDDWLTYGEKLDAWVSLFTGSAVRRAAGRVAAALTSLPTRAPDDLDRRGTFCFASECTRERATAHSRWDFHDSPVVYQGIDSRSFPHAGPSTGRPWRWRLLYVGRFDPRKGTEALLRAMPSLPPEAALDMYGRGSEQERARLERLATSLGVTDRVTFGTLGRGELAARYAAADVVVFPSEWEEPFGLVPLEAMACGAPVVATGVGGSGEFLVDGYNCVLFRPGDPAALAAAVERVHGDPGLRSRIVDGGKQTVEELDVDRLAEVLDAWHTAAADRFRHGRPPARVLVLPPAPGRGSAASAGQ